MSDECTLKVCSGICGKTSTLHAVMNEDMSVSVTIESDCPMVTKTPVPKVIPWEEIAKPMNQSDVYTWASENIGHTACPVPCAVVKAVEVAGGMALKKPVTMEFI